MGGASRSASRAPFNPQSLCVANVGRISVFRGEVAMADTSTHGKRVRSLPTGITPQQPRKRKSCRKGKKASASKRQLFDEAVPNTCSTVDSRWNREELRALIEFVALHSDRDAWPHTKKGDFWKSAAEFVAERGSDTMRTGKTNHTCSVNC